MKDEALKKEDEALNTEQEAGTEQTSEAGSGEAGNTEAAAETGETAEDVPEGAEEDTEQAPAAEKEEKKGNCINCSYQHNSCNIYYSADIYGFYIIETKV